MSQPDQQSQDVDIPYLVNDQWTHPKRFFNYEKLDSPLSFRLLRIERPPDGTNAPCHYSVIQTTVDQAPNYEALSYVWGTTDRSEIVTLKNGKFLRVTRQLIKALPFVEKQCSTGYIWIDQICIDQDDMNERGHQVGLMGQIYTLCVRVLIWLGQMTTLNVELPSVDPKQSQPSKDTWVSRISTVRHFARNLRMGTESGGSSGILQSPWFTRAWVFQEIVLPPAASFILATTSTDPHQALTISLPELTAMVNEMNRAGEVVDTIRFMYRQSSEERQKHEHIRSPIDQMLSHLVPRAKTSEDVDRLYAFFGLNFDTRISLTPSYNASLEEAMIDTAVSIIEGTRSLDLFEVIPRAVKNPMNDKDFPTWTPDFRKEHLVTPFKRSNNDFRRLAELEPSQYPIFISTATTYYRYVNRYAIYCAGEKKRMIQAWGYLLDQVDTEIGSLSSRTTIQDQLNSLLNRCIKVWSRKASTQKHTGERLRLGKISSDFDFDFATEPTMESLRQALTAEGRCALSSDRLLPSRSDPVGIGPYNEHIVMQEVMRGRTLWMTESGRLALGSYLRSGDLICLVHGCSNPVALRPQYETSKVLGTCFLEGWMGDGKIEKAKEQFTYRAFHMI